MENYNDDDTDDDDDEALYVPHVAYRDMIEEGFERKAPRLLTSNKPAYYAIDDSVTRSLATSKYSAKLTEYSLTVANAFFASVFHSATSDGNAALQWGAIRPAKNIFGQLENSQAVFKDLLRDRMFFLTLTSDPNASATQRDFAHNVLKNEFNPAVQNLGGSAKSNKSYADYEKSFLKVTQFASAKASANRHLSSANNEQRSGNGSGSSGSSGGNSASNTPLSKTQQKKKAAAKVAATSAAAAPAAGGEQREKKVRFAGHGNEAE